EARPNRPLEVFTTIAPFVFLVGLLVALSFLIAVCLDDPPKEPLARQAMQAEGKEKPADWQVRQWQYWAGIFNTSSAETLGRNPMVKDLKDEEKTRTALVVKLLLWLGGCVALALLASWCVGVNTFSLHGTYSNRLVRCYLGASRDKREIRTDQLSGQ